jgi:hypothetical protein
MSNIDCPLHEVDAVVRSLARNNTFCPNIDRTIFNLSKKRNETSHRNDYILATTIYFVDGTKVTVKNCVNDKVSVTTETIKLSDGTTKEVETASLESREIGVAYAILKRMICTPDEKGEVKGGFGSFLSKVIKEAWNQPVESAKIKAENEIRKAKIKENTSTKIKEEKPSLRKCVKELSDILASLKSKMA